jgi:hypothetical protein
VVEIFSFFSVDYRFTGNSQKIVFLGHFEQFQWLISGDVINLGSQKNFLPHIFFQGFTCKKLFSLSCLVLPVEWANRKKIDLRKSWNKNFQKSDFLKMLLEARFDWSPHIFSIIGNLLPSFITNFISKILID